MLRRTMVGVASAAVLFGVTATAASAETAVQAAIIQQDETISKAPGFKVVANFSKYKVGSLGKLAPEVAALGRLYANAGIVVARATPTSSKEKSGQADWVAGVREGSVEFRYLAKEMTDISKGDSTAAKTAATIAKKAADTALTELHKGDALLGLPKNA